MEFPQVGQMCTLEDCNQLDFLPVLCSHCKHIYCKDHYPSEAHNCENIKNNIVTKNEIYKSETCCTEGCGKTDPLNMNCSKCKNWFCVEHRHHKCTELEVTESKRQKWQIPKDQFKKAKENTDKVIRSKLESSKNRALVNKIKLMKLKRIAVGDNHIPTNDRIYFAVAPPLDNREKSEAKSLFTSKQWTLGRSIDLMAKRLKILNRNNDAIEHKLRLFTLDGQLICNEMNTLVSTLITNGSLVDGDSLILEYMNEKDINSGKTTFFKHPSELEKYVWI